MTEENLIALIQQTTRRRGRVRLGIGDDAAVLKDGTVVTTDAYAEGVHFDLTYMGLPQVGERCACGAISDVVAMAAEPEAVFVALALPLNATRMKHHASRRAGKSGIERDASSVEQLVRELYVGIESICSEMGCEVAGGDIIVADRLLLALTVTGKCRTPKLRSGARPGDRLYVTGFLGSAEAGRLLLKQQVKGRRSKVKGQAGRWALPLTGRHLRPVPRLKVMRALKSRIHGLIDTSDGLATDARHLAERSRARVILNSTALPILPATHRFCRERGLEPLDFALGAGEDYELLFAASGPLPGSIDGVKVTEVGRIEKGRGLWIESSGGILPVTVSGYDHLRVDSY